MKTLLEILAEHKAKAATVASDPKAASDIYEGVLNRLREDPALEKFAHDYAGAILSGIGQAIIQNRATNLQSSVAVSLAKGVMIWEEVNQLFSEQFKAKE